MNEIVSSGCLLCKVWIQMIILKAYIFYRSTILFKFLHFMKQTYFQIMIYNL